MGILGYVYMTVEVTVWSVDLPSHYDLVIHR